MVTCLRLSGEIFTTETIVVEFLLGSSLKTRSLLAGFVSSRSHAVANVAKEFRSVVLKYTVYKKILI